MDWHMILVGVIGFFAGMATALMLGAMVAAGQADEQDERRAARDDARRRQGKQKQKRTRDNTRIQETIGDNIIQHRRP